MRYEDFDLRIRPTLPDPDSGGMYEVVVDSSLAGEGRGTFGLSEEWTSEEALVGLGDLMRGGIQERAPGMAGTARRHLTVDGEPDEPWHIGERLFSALLDRHLTTNDEPDDPRRIGEKLFSALLGDVRNLYDFCRGGLWARDREATEESTGLRLRLHFDPSEPTSLAFHILPWEALYCFQDGGFLALNPKRSIVRHLDLPRSVEPTRFELPLRVLVVLSSPAALAPLDTALETEQIERAWGLQDEVYVTVLDRGTVGGLRRALRGGQFDVLHFVGHGDFNMESGEGVLFFNNENGKEEPVTASVLCRILQYCRPPSLVFLNACRTARLADSKGLDPFAGLPAALLQVGIPSVVAMQHPISDHAALVFSEGFYRSLAHGEGIDRAVFEGRLAIHMADQASFEWVTPALFLRCTEDRLFELPPVGPVLVSLSDTEVIPSPDEPKKLHSFQRDLYRFLGNLQIETLQDYARLGEEERSLVSREVLNRVIGLGTSPEDLLELRHMNARFPSKMLLRRPEIATSLDALHRQCALYADHSTVCLAPIKIPPSYGSSQEDPVLEESSIALLLRHKDLIETGKMSVVPEMVQVIGDRYRCLFDVRKLETVEVDLDDPVVRSVFLEKGKPFKQAGALVFKTQEGNGLRLPEILEVEDRYRAEYEYFQRHLRETLLAVNPDDDPHALRRALQAVDEGIRELDGQYQALRKRGKDRLLTALAGGALAVVVYATGVDVSPFLASACAGASLSSLVTFIPDARQIEDEIRRSPFFVPWLVARGKEAL